MASKKKAEGHIITMQELRPGMQVKIHQTIKELNADGEEKERTQFFAGMVIRRRGGNEQGATLTVYKETEGVGVEKIFPVHSPLISKVELLKQYRVRRANLSYLKEPATRLKEKRVVRRSK